MKLSAFADAIQAVPRAAIVHLKGSSANMFSCITPKRCMSAGVFALWYLDDCTHFVIDADSWEVGTLIEVVLAWLTLDPRRQAYAFTAAASRRSRQFLQGCMDVPDPVKSRLVIVEIEMTAAWSQFMEASSTATSSYRLDMNEWAYQVCAHCALSAAQAWRILCIGGNPLLRVEAEIAAAASTGTMRKGAKYIWLICDTTFTVPPRPATIAEWATGNQCNRLVGLQLLQSSAEESWGAEKDAAVLALGWCHDNAEWCRWSEEWETGAADIPGTEQCQAATIVPCSESSHLILSCIEGMGEHCDRRVKLELSSSVSANVQVCKDKYGGMTLYIHLLRPCAESEWIPTARAFQEMIWFLCRCYFCKRLDGKTFWICVHIRNAFLVQFLQPQFRLHHQWAKSNRIMMVRQKDGVATIAGFPRLTMMGAIVVTDAERQHVLSRVLGPSHAGC